MSRLTSASSASVLATAPETSGSNRADKPSTPLGETRSPASPLSSAIDVGGTTTVTFDSASTGVRGIAAITVAATSATAVTSTAAILSTSLEETTPIKKACAADRPLPMPLATTWPRQGHHSSMPEAEEISIPAGARGLQKKTRI